MKRWQVWLLTGIGGLALVLVVANIALFLGNRAQQATFNARQQSLNQSIRLARLNAQLIRALASISVQKNDPQLRDLLASHGVTYTVKPRATAGTTTAGQSP